MAGKATTMFDSVLRELLDAHRTAAIRETEAKADATQIGDLLNKVALLETRPTHAQLAAVIQNNRDLRDSRNGIAPPVLEKLFEATQRVLEQSTPENDADLKHALDEALDNAKNTYTVLPF